MLFISSPFQAIFTCQAISKVTFNLKTEVSGDVILTNTEDKKNKKYFLKRKLAFFFLLAEKTRKEMTSKGSTGIEVILSTLEVKHFNLSACVYAASFPIIWALNF